MSTAVEGKMFLLVMRPFIATVRYVGERVTKESKEPTKAKASLQGGNVQRDKTDELRFSL